ncbi:Tubulin-tyrosine ligase family protein [Trichomonas vaginalis G3]|uniref:Tubulin-tyrosine ligase family protein n=1 Tax=Trichomonas vaginalis (strain ATCC PRA-98 / G3) TaxID=412133 RepID=A2F744_TRIV3|nr:positive regulation of cilium movement [Trichomonas vaginalis G3]EAX99281.1 Tubulin-tyrosine ligase family protein [Trichomonas vaginalis G3]KAI5524947.1 positive regulation of cilium movement [Trichomonas vaginalis G3]|eukprot:XP_001312211.1 Tubulin-tyrosine ligase family protein [Trichomonas vaginalis G3]
MSGVKATIIQLKFNSVIQAFQEAGIPYDENNPSAVLVWHDTLNLIDYYKFLHPWQVVNRIPYIHLLCRKSSFARLIQHMKEYFPEEYSFVPKTYILPFEGKRLKKAIAKKNVRHIIKPDGGSLGVGITIIDPGNEYAPEDILAVGQEYIESHTIDDRKYDLRVYVLVASVSPLTVYVYRDGVARFCSSAQGANSVYSQITNVGLNKFNVGEKSMEEISKLISDIIPKMQITPEELWSRIDRVAVLTILSCYKYFEKGVNDFVKSIPYPRCFQILGFDILLDKDLMPHVLEVNYRPSLDYYRPPERRMKVSMIRDAIRIGCPLSQVQACISERSFGWDGENFSAFISQSQNLIDSINNEKKSAVKNSKFVRVYPSTDKIQETYNNILATVKSLPFALIPGFNV